MRLTLSEAPTRETRPGQNNRNYLIYSFQQYVGSLMSPANHVTLKMYM